MLTQTPSDTSMLSRHPEHLPLSLLHLARKQFGSAVQFAFELTVVTDGEADAVVEDKV